jgi:hypothetical protein
VKGHQLEGCAKNKKEKVKKLKRSLNFLKSFENFIKIIKSSQKYLKNFSKSTKKYHKKHKKLKNLQNKPKIPIHHKNGASLRVLDLLVALDQRHSALQVRGDVNQPARLKRPRHRRHRSPHLRQDQRRRALADHFQPPHRQLSTLPVQLLPKPAVGVGDWLRHQGHLAVRLYRVRARGEADAERQPHKDAAERRVRARQEPRERQLLRQQDRAHRRECLRGSGAAEVPEPEDERLDRFVRERVCACADVHGPAEGLHQDQVWRTED